MSAESESLFDQLSFDPEAPPRAMAETQARVRGFMDRLGDAPPQVLLLEGGSAEERLALALYWACRVNCRVPGGQGSPCLACRPCRQLLAGAHRDLFFLDGSRGFIKIDSVRALRPVLGEPPREGGCRVVILHEAQSMRAEAANALLKSLEEPRPGNTFLLLAPQRERLLPTLVSRGFVLTLDWPHAAVRPEGDDPALAEWGEALEAFLRGGAGWFGRTSAKGAVDRDLAQRLVAHLQRELAALMAGAPRSGLANLWAERLDPDGLRHLDLVLCQAQDALNFTVNPALTLDWLATRLFARTRRA